MAHKNSDVEKIKELIAIMKENDLVEVELKHGDDKVFIKRSGGRPAAGQITTVPIISPAAAPAPAGPAGQPSGPAEKPASAEQQTEAPAEISSPIVGTFYATPSPDSDAYVEVGSHVDETTVVCIIEAMKVMNEIKAELSGTIVEIVAQNGQAVEYGQVLFRVRPD